MAKLTLVVSWRVVLAATLVAGCDGDLRFTRPTSDGAAEIGSADAGPEVGRCTNDSTCAPLRCEPVSGMCVPCLVDTHCTGDERRCDPGSRRCIECIGPDDCGGSERCDATLHRCVRICTTASDCGPSEAPVCDARGFCVCTASSCGSGDRTVCDPTGRCVECTLDSHCRSDLPRCDVARGVCVAD